MKLIVLWRRGIGNDFPASRTDLSPQGGGVFESITNLRISDDALPNLVSGKLSQNETTLLQTPEFSGFANWPADASSDC